MKKYLFILLLIDVCFGQRGWETAIFAEDLWKYIVPTSSINENWNNINFDDSAWMEGIGGFGYGDNDDGTILDQINSVYFRRVFEINDISKLKKGLIHADYDDGFVAYVNGFEIGRSSNLSDFGSYVPFDANTSFDQEASLYLGYYPDEIILDSLDIMNLLIEGQNVLAIQVHNVSTNSSDMSGNFYLSFEVQDTVDMYDEVPDWFIEPIIFNTSNLPIMVIDTYGNQILDEPRIDAFMGIIDNDSGVNIIGDNYNGYDGQITIEKRGNSSQWNDKTPYRFETVNEQGENNNVSLLGMPEENDWVLYAPWQDKSMIRNILTYKISNDLDRYAPRTKLIELYLNDEYKGVYVLMEKIKRDANRVNISKLNSDEISGDDLTGGYILKFDWFFTGDNLGGFESDIDGNIYNYHYPKPSDIVPEQENYIINYINDFETIMSSDQYNDQSTGYPSVLNVDSFVDFILLQELAKNVDAYRLSTYLYKDKESVDNRLTAGPVWDFNHGYGNCDYGETWEFTNWLLEYNPEGGDQMSFWWELIWQDDYFQNKISERYTELRSTVFSEIYIYGVIDSLVNELGSSVDRNFSKWPILGLYVWPNYYVFDTFEQEIDYLKGWISDRLNWMDSQILLLNSRSSSIPIDFHLNQNYPNPFNPITTLSYSLPKDELVNITIFDIMGRPVKIIQNSYQTKGFKFIKWDAKNDRNELVSAGLYFYTIQAGEFRQTRKMVLLK
tara:strand:- start:1671 stop:3848 length:2178 start_codon:yes stop_codon:yes gene_type:complete